MVFFFLYCFFIPFNIYKYLVYSKLSPTPAITQQQQHTCIIMELSHSLTLNEEAFKQIPDHKKPVFLFEWLRFLDKVLVAAQKVNK